MLPVVVYFVVIEGLFGVLLALEAILAIAAMARVTNRTANTGWPGTCPATLLNNI